MFSKSDRRPYLALMVALVVVVGALVALLAGGVIDRRSAATQVVSQEPDGGVAVGVAPAHKVCKCRCMNRDYNFFMDPAGSLCSKINVATDASTLDGNTDASSGPLGDLPEILGEMLRASCDPFFELSVNDTTKSCNHLIDDACKGIGLKNDGGWFAEKDVSGKIGSCTGPTVQAR